MSKKIIFAILLIVLLSNLVVVSGVNAQAASIYDEVIEEQLTTLQEETGLPGGDTAGQRPVEIVARVIKTALGLLALIFLILIIIAGFKWMTAGGNEETIGAAKKTIQNSVIGVIIIFFAYAITLFIFRVLLTYHF